MRRFVLCPMGLALSACATTPPASSPWTEDSRAFVAALEAHHPNPSHHVPLAELRRRADRVSAAPDPLTALAEVVAAVGDGHTVLPMLSLPFDGAPAGPPVKLLPIRLEWFDDGLFVVGADRAHAPLVGGRVEAIGGVSTSEALRRVMKLLPHATPRFAAEYAPEWLLADRVLRHAGLMGADGRARLTISGRSVELAPVEPTQKFDWLLSRTGGMTADWVATPEGLPVEGSAAAILADGNFYVRIDQLRDPPGSSWKNFVASVSDQHAAMPGARLIIDIRDCIGGDGTLAPELVDWLASDPRFRAKGRLVVLIGRRTHSAGIMLASAIEQRTSAVLVGQPTGDAPNHYGETNILVLPYSKLPVIHASRYWQTAQAGDRRRWIAPHVAVPFNHADFIRGIDRTLDTARSLQ